jgi:transcriptional regulator with XRE-family HTH domain
MNFLNRKIRTLRKSFGMTQAEFAKALGVSQSQVSRWEREVNPEKPEMPNIEKLSHLAKMSVDEFLELLEHGMLVPIVGYVRAGAEMVLFSEGQGNFDTVEAPRGSTPSTVAVEIRGDSLGEGFSGWLAFYDQVMSPPTENLIGRMCVVGLDDGRVLIKRLQKGQLPGKYNLLAVSGPPIYDVSVSWAAKVLHLSQDR